MVSHIINGNDAVLPGASLRSSISSPQAWQEAQEVNLLNSIKEFIKEIVDEEDPKSPYSDQDAGDAPEKGIKISRRTVAKYR